jgi:predicted porin
MQDHYDVITMRKTLLAAAVSLCWAASSHAQSSVTLYGIVDTAVIYANNQTTGKAGAPGHSGVEMDSGGISGTRWGVRGWRTVFRVPPANSATRAICSDARHSSA